MISKNTDEDSWDIFWNFKKTLGKFDKRLNEQKLTVDVVSRFIKKWGKYEL